MTARRSSSSRVIAALGLPWRRARGVWRRFNDDDALRLAASLAFYSIFSLAPLLVIVVAIAGLVFGDEAVSGRLSSELRGFMGHQSAETLQSMVESARKPTDSVVAMIVGIATMLFGASGVFTQLRDALNRVWDVDGEPEHGWRSVVIGRFLSFAMVLCIGFLLLVSLVITTLLDALNERLSASLPLPGAIWQAIHFVVSLGVITLLFALMFRYLAETSPKWRDTWRGAVLTALLFSGGRHVLGLYLARESTASAYGSAGSVVVILMWVYFSAITVLVGAEFIQVLADERPSGAGARAAAARRRAGSVAHAAAR